MIFELMNKFSAKTSSSTENNKYEYRPCAECKFCMTDYFLCPEDDPYCGNPKIHDIEKNKITGNIEITNPSLRCVNLRENIFGESGLCGKIGDYFEPKPYPDYNPSEKYKPRLKTPIPGKDTYFFQGTRPMGGELIKCQIRITRNKKNKKKYRIECRECYDNKWDEWYSGAALGPYSLETCVNHFEAEKKSMIENTNKFLRILNFI